MKCCVSFDSMNGERPGAELRNTTWSSSVMPVKMQSNRAEEAREYMERRDKDKRIGQSFGTELTKRVDELEQKLADYDRFESDAKRVRGTLDLIDKVLKKHGVSYWSSYDDGSRAKEIDELLTRKYPKELDAVVRGLHEALDAVDDLRKVTV